ncbi:2-oxoglutarate dehydrogenase, E2 component, dihydrolipoamide succinyltransferase [Williamsia sp. SKLECPSW1]
MAFSVQMPALGESVTEGTVTRWLKQEGDTVTEDEPLLEVSTDKVDTEIPAPTSGVLTKIIAQEDDVVEVGGDLAEIGEEGEAPSGGDDSGSDDAGDSDESGGTAPQEQSGDSPADEPEPSADADEPATKPSGGAGSNGGGDGTDVTMPELGESVTEGTVTNWLKSVGDEVAEDEPLLEVSTDKVDTEIPSPVAGTLLEIVANEDDVVEVGGRLAVIGSGSPASSGGDSGSAPSSDDADADSADADSDSGSSGAGKESVASESDSSPQPEPDAPKKESAPQQESASKDEPTTESSSAGDSSRSQPDTLSSTPYVTPLVRKLAQENDVDLESVTGTGVGGRIRKQDVLAAAEESKKPAEQSAPAASAPSSTPSTPSTPSAPKGVRPELAELRGTTQKVNRIRLITAKKTRESLQTSAQLTQVFEVDMTRVVALRAAAKASFKSSEGVNLTYLPIIAKATVEALKAHPNVNASIDEDAKEITYHGSVNLGIAVDTEQGLLSPVIHNADDLSIAGLARAIADIASRARENKLKPDELAGGTFTITNIGSQGALFDTPILVPPQAAMLGTGAIVKRPTVITAEDGSESIAVRSMSFLPLTYDHRLVDGADAGRFLTTVKHRLEEAAFGAELGL